MPIKSAPPGTRNSRRSRFRLEAVGHDRIRIPDSRLEAVAIRPRIFGREHCGVPETDVVAELVHQHLKAPALQFLRMYGVSDTSDSTISPITSQMSTYDARSEPVHANDIDVVKFRVVFPARTGNGPLNLGVGRDDQARLAPSGRTESRPRGLRTVNRGHPPQVLPRLRPPGKVGHDLFERHPFTAPGRVPAERLRRCRRSGVVKQCARRTGTQTLLHRLPIPRAPPEVPTAPGVGPPEFRETCP